MSDSWETSEKMRQFARLLPDVPLEYLEEPERDKPEMSALLAQWSTTCDRAQPLLAPPGDVALPANLGEVVDGWNGEMSAEVSRSLAEPARREQWVEQRAALERWSEADEEAADGLHALGVAVRNLLMMASPTAARVLLGAGRTESGEASAEEQRQALLKLVRWLEARCGEKESAAPEDAL